MPYVACSELAYAHPGGDLLFSGVSFRISAGRKVGVVGINGIGKSTLFGVLTGELSPEEGEVSVEGRLAHMPQDVGVAGEPRTVRELLVALAPGGLRSAGECMATAERRLAGGNDDAGMDLATAIGDWSELGGYELEGQWDAACRRIVRSSFAELAERPATTLSGGERKQLVLDVLFASDAHVLLLDEPDNFLDVPAKRALERQIAGSKKTVVVISHDRELLAAAVSSILTIEGDGAWMHTGSYATYPQEREKRQRKLGDAVKRWKEEERRLFSLMKTFKASARCWDPLRPRYENRAPVKPCGVPQELACIDTPRSASGAFDAWSGRRLLGRLGLGHKRRRFGGLELDATGLDAGADRHRRQARLVARLELERAVRRDQAGVQDCARFRAVHRQAHACLSRRPKPEG